LRLVEVVEGVEGVEEKQVLNKTEKQVVLN
jgi:hypothetical protein